ncbi:MAG: aromatic amino acid lyase [Proteobacteria bacterium]|nr:aromatic amino acid lyase [Pseudomonadota bacterium]
MGLVVDCREDVTLEGLRRVAFEGEAVRFSERALKRIAAAHESFQRCLGANADGFIYGLTSGHGPDASKRYSLEETRERRRRRKRSWGPFGGEPLPEYVSRGAVFACLASLVSGHAAVHPERALAVLGLLDGTLPQLPSRGLTAAGELAPNRVLLKALPIDDHVSAGWGFHTEAAMAGIAALLARRRLRLAEITFALSIEAFMAPLDAYDPALKVLWGDPYESIALDTLATLLQGAGQPRRPYQAPVSYRILPKVLGQAHRAVAALDDVSAVALRTDQCNPTYVLPDDEYPQGRALSNGGFHNAAAAPAIDAVTAGWANLGMLAHRHAVKMHRGEVSLLPDRLLPKGTDVTTGHSTTYMEYVPTGFVEEMRRLAQPTLIPTSDIAASQQDDIAITTPLAFVNERRAAECFDATLAVLGVVASQALHVTSRPAPSSLRRFTEALRQICPPVDSHRSLASDCARLSDAFSNAVAYSRSPFLALI